MARTKKKLINPESVFIQHIDFLKGIIPKASKKNRDFSFKITNGYFYSWNYENSTLKQKYICKIENLKISQQKKGNLYLEATSDRLYLPDITKRVLNQLHNIREAIKSHKYFTSPTDTANTSVKFEDKAQKTFSENSHKNTHESETKHNNLTLQLNALSNEQNITNLLESLNESIKKAINSDEFHVNIQCICVDGLIIYDFNINQNIRYESFLGLDIQIIHLNSLQIIFKDRKILHKDLFKINLNDLKLSSLLNQISQSINYYNDESVSSISEISQINTKKNEDANRQNSLEEGIILDSNLAQIFIKCIQNSTYSLISENKFFEDNEEGPQLILLNLENIITYNEEFLKTIPSVKFSKNKKQKTNNTLTTQDIIHFMSVKKVNSVLYIKGLQDNYNDMLFSSSKKIELTLNQNLKLTPIKSILFENKINKTKKRDSKRNTLSADVNRKNVTVLYVDVNIQREVLKIEKLLKFTNKDELLGIFIPMSYVNEIVWLS